MLLRAEGPAFCAGYQLDWATSGQAAAESASARVWDSAVDVQMIGRYASTWAKLHTLSKPTIAAVQGWCTPDPSRLLGTLFDGVARHPQEGQDFVARSVEVGFRQAVRERDDPFGDYGSRRSGTIIEKEYGMGFLRKESGSEGRKFQMRQKMMSIGDDYWIEDEAGNKAFKVDGKAMSIRDTWILEDANGREVATIREKKLSIRDKIKIEMTGADGQKHEAQVKKGIVGIRDRFEVDVENGKDLKVKGNFADHEYKIERDGDKIAEISKKWFKLRETYGVEIEHEADVVLILAVTVAVDAMSHELA